MTDREIVDGIVRRDNLVTRQFFFENCRPLFLSIIKLVFSYQIDYDEFVGELYTYLMEGEAFRLKQFDGRSSLYQWMKTVALRYALRLRKKDILIDNTSKEPLSHKQNLSDNDSWKQSKIDIDNLLSQMPNKRQAYVIRRHLIDGVDEPTLAEEMGVKVSNLYNIKKRAMSALTKVALTDIQRYGKTNK